MTVKVLHSQEQIERRVTELAQNVTRDLGTENLAVIGLLEDSFVFMADLIRKIEGEMVCYFMKADVEEEEQRVSRVKRIFYSPELDIHDKNVLLIGGVLDTGVTLDYLTKHLLQGGPKQLKTCYLIDKPYSRRISANADYAGFVVDSSESRFIVGYGLAHSNRFRNLPFLATLTVA
ncbi:MAG: phosphoribosyltransferase family protein [Acidobacteriota bacterium]